MKAWKDGWLIQRRRVRRLNRFVERKRARQHRLGEAVKSEAIGMLSRFESLVLISATGAVWAARIRDQSEEEPSRPVFNLAVAALVVRRWQRWVERANTLRTRH